MSLQTLNSDNLNILEAGPDQPAGTTFGETASSLTSFHGATPVAQRAGSAQAAVPSDGSGTLAQTITLVNELRAALVQKGIIKGAA